MEIIGPTTEVVLNIFKGFQKERSFKIIAAADNQEAVNRALEILRDAEGKLHPNLQRGLRTDKIKREVSISDAVHKPANNWMPPRSVITVTFNHARQEELKDFARHFIRLYNRPPQDNDTEKAKFGRKKPNVHLGNIFV